MATWVSVGSRGSGCRDTLEWMQGHARVGARRRARGCAGTRSGRVGVPKTNFQCPQGVRRFYIGTREFTSPRFILLTSNLCVAL